MTTTTLTVLIGFANIFCVGLLAGEEFVIRYGVRAPLASLNNAAHIQFRQALIYTLRILVPTIFGLSLLSGIAVTLLGGSAVSGFIWRCGGVLALIAFISLTLSGTVPINQAVLAWNATALPNQWQAVIKRWERLDTIRCWLAMAAFALFLTAMTLV